MDTNNNEIDHPRHYTQCKVNGAPLECIDVIEALSLPHHVACAFKYLWRYRDKGGLKDLRKAAWYILRYCDKEEARRATPKVEPIPAQGGESEMD